ncbi:hypothetical protein CLOLEP_02222 [[Clostridium] leptum DSM 753]|uniref:Uncharacterized protein n=1 Tax=[Clostridium] leptum DSM 753 TaxID=428125 RepID=A7VUH6_9FIRM|nr:hypothetical protein CLOLEP_02222 [[Clostridium] leptum DSM 753]
MPEIPEARFSYTFLRCPAEFSRLIFPKQKRWKRFLSSSAFVEQLGLN